MTTGKINYSIQYLASYQQNKIYLVSRDIVFLKKLLYHVFDTLFDCTEKKNHSNIDKKYQQKYCHYTINNHFV